MFKRLWRRGCHMNNFEMFLIAHLIGDFLLQNNWMALNKTKKTTPLIVHAYLYSFCMLAFFPTMGPYRFFSVFFLHALIDMFSLADKWLRLIRGRSFESVDKQQNWEEHKWERQTWATHHLMQKQAPVYRDTSIYISFT
ncbi:hypothetical protein DRO66_00480, partial [Candidatus Bathyarchaeota archaeon]